MDRSVAFSRVAAQRMAQSSPASQQSNTDEDAEEEEEEELSCAFNGRNRNGIAAPASQSSVVSASSCTSQQQQQKLPAQQQNLPAQQCSQQLQQQVQSYHLQQNKSQTASGMTTAPPGPISGGEGRRISCEDIQVVQNLIERCLQLYMNRVEVINTLLKAKIEPGFTGLVWQKLEEQNPEFFKAYYVRLKLKKQIVVFNHLLEKHAQLSQRMHPANAPLPTIQNEMHTSQVPIGYPVPQQPAFTATNHPHIVQMPVASLSSPVLSGTPAPEAFDAAHGNHGSNGVVDMSSDISLLPTASGIPLNNDLSMGAGAVLHNNSAFPFNAVGNPTDMPVIGMDVPANFPPDAPFHSSENHSQNGMGTIHMNTDTDASGVRDSLGLLGQLPRSFSLSDLTAELTCSTDLLGSYTGSPFLSPDADVFIHSPDDENMLDQVTDSCGCDEFEDEK